MSEHVKSEPKPANSKAERTAPAGTPPEIYAPINMEVVSSSFYVDGGYPSNGNTVTVTLSTATPRTAQTVVANQTWSVQFGNVPNGTYSVVAAVTTGSGTDTSAARQVQVVAGGVTHESGGEE